MPLEDSQEPGDGIMVGGSGSTESTGPVVSSDVPTSIEETTLPMSSDGGDPGNPAHEVGTELAASSSSGHDGDGVSQHHILTFDIHSVVHENDLECEEDEQVDGEALDEEVPTTPNRRPANIFYESPRDAIDFAICSPPKYRDIASLGSESPMYVLNQVEPAVDSDVEIVDIKSPGSSYERSRDDIVKRLLELSLLPGPSGFLAWIQIMHMVDIFLVFIIF